MTKTAMRRREGRGWAAALLVLMLAGCTSPELIPPAPMDQTPTLATDHFETRDGMRLPVRRWLPDGPIEAAIVALHGFNDYSAFVEVGAALMAARGIATYAYDQRGFGNAGERGRWYDTQLYLSDARDVTKAVSARHPGVPLIILGESMGGAVAMTMLSREDAPWIDGAILSAPAVWGREVMPWYQRGLLWLAAHTVPGLTLGARGVDIQPSDNIDMLRELGRDPLVIKDTRVDALFGLVNLMDVALAAPPSFDTRALILYGERDEIVKAEPTRLMIGRLPAGARERQRVAVYADGYHMLLRDLQAETVWNDIAHWIRHPSTPLPSGADTSAKAFLAGR